MSGDTQFGFIKGLGTREALFSVKLLAQKCYDQRQDVFIYFIDYQGAFDNVKHEPLMERLQEIGVDGKDIRIIKEVYWQQSAEIRIDGDRTTETFSVLKIDRDVYYHPFCLTSTLRKSFRWPWRVRRGVLKSMASQ